MTYSHVGYHDQLQYQYESNQSYQCNQTEWQQSRMGRNNSWIGVRQKCLPTPNFFNIFFEIIMSASPEEQNGNVTIVGRTIQNVHRE